MMIASVANSGYLMVTSCAMRPPIDHPSTAALVIPRPLTKATASSAAAPSVVGTSPGELLTPVLSKRTPMTCGDRIDKCGVPVIHGSTKSLQENHGRAGSNASIRVLACPDADHFRPRTHGGLGACRSPR